jgi:Bacteriophage lambda head decoration protein D
MLPTYPILTDEMPPALVLCEDCCVSDSAARIPDNVNLARGTVVQLDSADGLWKPIAAAPTLTPATTLGVLRFAVDTTGAPVAVGLGVVVTANATVNASQLVFPVGISAADKAAVWRHLLNQAVKGIPAPALV